MKSNIEEKRLTATEAVRNFQEAAHIYSERKKAYNEGYEQGIKDYAARMKKYYSALTGKTLTAVVRYALTIMEQEMLKENKEDKGDGE